MKTIPADTALKSKVEEALKALGQYQRGSPRGTLRALETLVNEAAGSAELRRSLERSLTDALAQASPLQAEVICNQLVRVGSDASVPALEKALYAPATFEWARAALAALNSKRARALLVESAARLSGVQQIGVVQTLGLLREDTAVRILGRLVRSSSPGTREAATKALGEIASPRCARILTAGVNDRLIGQTQPSADAFLVCAARLIEAGRRKEGTRLSEAVLNWNVPEYMKAAARATLMRASV